MANRTIITLFTIGALLGAASTARSQRWGRGPVPGSGACFYQDTNYRGEYFCVGAGENVGRVPDDMNDRISSIKVFGRANVVVFKDVRFSGGSTRFDSDVRDLRDQGWNDRISSMRVQIGSSGGSAGDRSDNRRDRGGEDPERIVRRAYQDVLGRDPDAGGLRQYRSRIIDDGWTEAQIRESLRNSPEYRDKVTMTRAKAEGIVRSAYLAVLKREPDAAGSA
jgi:hypothetical protein